MRGRGREGGDVCIHITNSQQKLIQHCNYTPVYKIHELWLENIG